jgi:hypothetical protein
MDLNNTVIKVFDKEHHSTHWSLCHMTGDKGPSIHTQRQLSSETIKYLIYSRNRNSLLHNNCGSKLQKHRSPRWRGKEIEKGFIVSIIR